MRIIYTSRWEDYKPLMAAKNSNYQEQRTLVAKLLSRISHLDELHP